MNAQAVGGQDGSGYCTRWVRCDAQTEYDGCGQRARQKLTK